MYHALLLFLRDFFLLRSFLMLMVRSGIRDVSSTNMIDYVFPSNAAYAILRFGAHEAVVSDVGR